MGSIPSTHKENGRIPVYSSESGGTMLRPPLKLSSVCPVPFTSMAGTCHGQVSKRVR